MLRHLVCHPLPFLGRSFGPLFKTLRRLIQSIAQLLILFGEPLHFHHKIQNGLAKGLRNLIDQGNDVFVGIDHIDWLRGGDCRRSCSCTG